MQFKGIDITQVNFSTWELIHRAAQKAGDKPYIIYTSRDDSAITFGEFEATVNRISNLLVAEYGVKQGDKVCTMSENMPELLYMIMAIVNIGAVWVPINVMLVGESLSYIIEASDAKYVCASKKYNGEVERVLDKVHQPVEIMSLIQLTEKAKEISSVYQSKTKPDDMAMIIFTSGTTGFPKGVLHTHNTYIRTGVRGLEALKTDSSDRIHLYLPLFHGWAYLVMLGALYNTCTIIMEDRFHAETYWETVEKYGITQDHWTGTVPLSLMQLPETEYEKTADFRIVGTFGALYEDMKTRWPNLIFQSLYGQTEHPFMTLVPPDQIFPGSDGIPKYPDEILILDNDGKPLPQGETGEIMLRCKCGVLMKGYYKNEEATQKTLKGTDMYTGDLGFLDEKGHLHFVGRKKDALRVRGEMVSVEHIEYLINAHKKIAESAIVGHRPPKKEALKEDEIVAHIVLLSGESMTSEEFNEWSQQNLARFMRPKYLVFQKELPKTATERVQRFKLREKGIEGATQLF
ncbi:MAG: class I adenylate-forming enzyme family protein [Dissulfuribacterales bacterium]